MRRLREVNREFYSRFAGDFSAARPAARVNVEPIMPYLADGVKVLDAGCGNGRTAARLDECGYRLRYWGVDESEALLQLARGASLHSVRAEFVRADITAPGWPDLLRAEAPFDLALALAVLHHVPSFALRAQVLRALRTLLRAGGTLVLSDWQFASSERLRGKVVPWSAVGLDARDVEAGDALLNWKRGGEGIRYVHWVSREEVVALAADSGFALSTQFEAAAGLDLYSVLRAPA